MLNYIKKLEKEIAQSIRRIESVEHNIVNQSLLISNRLDDLFGQLKDFILQYQFKTEEEEILFFKEIKPRIHCKLIYYRKIYNIELNRPISGVDVCQDYLQQELGKLQDYIDKRLDFYRYYKSGATHLDRDYFLRGLRPLKNQYLDCSYYERDPLFSTECDFRIAKFLANDMLCQYIINEMMILEEHKLALRSDIKLTWMDTKTDLCELIFALHAKGSFGSIPLTRLANYIQNVFNIELNSNFSRTFSDMCLRNDPTPYLDHLTNSLLEKMKRQKKKM